MTYYRLADTRTRVVLSIQNRCYNCLQEDWLSAFHIRWLGRGFSGHWRHKKIKIHQKRDISNTISILSRVLYCITVSCNTYLQISFTFFDKTRTTINTSVIDRNIDIDVHSPSLYSNVWLNMYPRAMISSFKIRIKRDVPLSEECRTFSNILVKICTFLHENVSGF